MSLIRFALEWPEVDVRPIWDRLLATEDLREILGDDTLQICCSVSHEMLLAAVAAGQPYDGVGDSNTDCLMALGLLHPLDEWVAGSKIIAKENYLPATWERLFHEGGMYAIPAFESAPFRYGFQYNAALVADAGLDPDSPPKTFGEAYEWHRTLTKFDGSGNLVQLGLDPFDAMGGVAHIADGFFPAVAWGWEWYDPQTGQFDLDNPKMIESIETMGEFIKPIGPDRLRRFRAVKGQESWGNAFSTGVQAMVIEGYCNPGETCHDSPEVGRVNRPSWVLVPESRRGERVQLIGGCDTVVFKQSRHAEKVFRIAEFLNTKTACDIIYEGRGWLPAMMPYIRSVDLSRYPGLDFYLGTLKDATDVSVTVKCPVTRHLARQWGALRARYHRGELNAREVAGELQRSCSLERLRMEHGH